MATIYNSQLDAFGIYHQTLEDQRPVSLLSPDGTILPALGHAFAGSTGAAISNVATYPLDLIITRLQIQRQLRKDQSQPSKDEYKGFQDAATKIYENEGGLPGFYTGLLQDTGKSIVDSFFFFLAYNYLRNRRVAAKGDSKSLPAIDELGVGFVAGSFTKLLTTPIANIVTRKQAAVFTAANASSDTSAAPKSPSSSQIAHDILRQKGVLGFWSGYSASLVLTLNPSLTFFLFETLKRLLLPRSRRQNPPAAATFFLAAISKACASSVTYPFSLAKSRAQASSSPEDEEEEDKVIDQGTKSDAKKAAARSTIFSTVLTIAQNEGLSGLYEGLELEIVKGFFSHGFTMLVKQAIHRFIIQSYYVLSVLVQRYKGRANPVKLAERAKEQSVEYYDLAIRRAAERVQDAKAKIAGKADDIAEFVGEYIEEDDQEWRSLYGTTGLARWLNEK